MRNSIRLPRSRARYAGAADAERLRIERRLRDRVAPRLTAVTGALSRARDALRDGGDAALAASLDRAVAGSRAAAEDLRDLARGVPPAILVDAGLLPALEAAARSLRLPVTIEGPTAAGRPPSRIEAAAYFVAMEALTNVVKHAAATAASVTVALADGRLQVEVRDDGAGGAAAGRGGSGLRGMADRIEALGGALEVVSPAGGGTSVRFWLPAGAAEPPEPPRASRARIVEAADAERRRIERDLHDGAQQRLVTLSMQLTLLRAAGAGADPVVAACLQRAAGELRAALDELRELTRGLRPAIPHEAGLAPAPESLADRGPGGRARRHGATAMRLVLADDFVLFREGLARLVSEAGFEVVGQAGDVSGLMEAVAAHEPDAAVIDIRMPPTCTTEGLEAAARIRTCHPGVGVMLLSHHVEVHHAVQMLDRGEGGIGYLLKGRVEDLSRFADALRRVCRGERVIDPLVVSSLLDRTRQLGRLDSLTERERVVLRLLAEGRSNHGIRVELGVTDRTVETHVRSILMKLEVPDAEGDHRRVLAALSYLRGRIASDLSTGTDDRERVSMR